MIFIGNISSLPVVLLVFCIAVVSEADPIVSIPHGNILGEYVTYEETTYLNIKKDFQVYRGIPFAEPPVDDLRFGAPVAKEHWDGLWNATYYRSACEQVNPGLPVFEVETTSEDCLYLNVYVPDPKPTNVPVMVWIHGGGYAFGAGTTPTYDPYPLMAVNDFIYVTINYRLGAYGFLYTGDDSAPGNAGMLDQVQALEWISSNIAAFGGNPNQITVGGESAGASSSHLLTLSPLTRGLFHRAILQSGSALSPWAVELDKEKVVAAAYGVAEFVGCPTQKSTRELVDCLRNVEAGPLTRASMRYLLTTVYNELPFAPIVDGYFLMDEPANILRRKEFMTIDLLLGTNADEGSLWALRAYPSYFLRDTQPPMSLEEFRENLPVYTYDYKTSLESKSIEQQYIDWSKVDDPNADYLSALIAFTTDQAFACPADMTARSHVSSSSGNSIYLYHMTHVPNTSVFNLRGRGPEWLGCVHAEDLQFVFGWKFNPLVAELVDQTPDEITMSIEILKYWTNFIVSGNPNSDSAFDPWLPYTVPELNYKVLSTALTNSRALKAKQCAFWNSQIARVSTFTDDLEDVQDEWEKETQAWRDQDLPAWKTEFEEYKNADSFKN